MAVSVRDSARVWCRSFLRFFLAIPRNTSVNMVTSYPACCRPGKQRPRKGGSSHSPGSTYIPFIYAWTLRFPLRAAGHGHLRWCPDPRNAWERLFNRNSFLNLMYFNMDSFCLKKPCKYECLKESICIIAR
jgi:hypothetical protein